MAISIDALEVAALNLPAAERSRLLERLIASFEPEASIRDAWIQEAERRDEEIESGAVQMVSGEEAIARIRATLR